MTIWSTRHFRSRALKDPSLTNSLRGVRSEDVARTLGRENCIKLGMKDIFEGSFTRTPDRFLYLISADLTLNGVGPAVKKFSESLREIAAAALFAQPTEELLVPREVVLDAIALL